MIKAIVTTILLILSLTSSSQTFNIKGSDGTVSFVSKKTGQEIIFDAPSIKTKFTNFVYTPRDSSYPSSISESFLCKDSKNETWMFYSVVIGLNKIFILNNSNTTIQVIYSSTPKEDKELYYVFEKIKLKKTLPKRTN